MPVGTHTDPNPADVRSGVTWGADGIEFTGTLVIPGGVVPAAGSAYHLIIATAIKNKIDVLNSVPTSVIRAEAWRIEDETIPLIIISMGDEHEGVATFGGSKFRQYDTMVTVIYAGRVELETNIDSAKKWRDAIRGVIKLTQASTTPFLPGAPLVWDIDVLDLPALDPGDFAATYETARLGVFCRTNE